MASRTYEDAIDALNSLQTNFKTLEKRRTDGIKSGDSQNVELISCLKRIGYSRRDLDKLNIVHVAGTKGKGTTCAFVDSILAQYQKSHGIPKKAGLFTSPHLVSVRERIRINSTPISSELFTKYFFDVWDKLEESAKELSLDPADKPAYFRYLTLMSYHVYLSEGVDAAVYEVGVGGEYDSTNIVEGPAVTGISTLGIDHIQTLGSTIEEISWHKAGIMKTGSPAFTVEQVPGAAKVLQDRAKEKEVDLKVLDINPALKDAKIQPNAKFQQRNATLAIALASTVLKKLDPEFSMPDDSLPKEFIDGLEQVVWRGRCETKVMGNIRWFVDGAHTADSLKVSAKWFGGESAQYPGKRVLIFNQQGRPEANDLLTSFFTTLQAQGLTKFDHVVFCTNVTYAEKGYKKDFVNKTYDPEAIAHLTVQKGFASTWSNLDPSAIVSVTPSIESALEYVKNLAKSEKEVQAFITGSLHLVGGALGLLEGKEVL